MKNYYVAIPYAPTRRIARFNIRPLLRPFYCWPSMRFGILLWLLVTGVLPAVSAQTIRYVSVTGTNNNPATATSWATSTTNLQGAINSLTATGGQVWVAAGVYKPTSTTARTISFSMRNNVAIYGGFVGTESNLNDRPALNPITGQPSSTTLSGDIGTPGDKADNTYQVFINPGGITSSAILDGFVITGGNADASANYPYYNGGAMYNNGNDGGCNPTVRNCLFQANSGTYGGAIYNFGYTSNRFSSPTLTNCAFVNNYASSAGGAIYNMGGQQGNSSPVLTNCLFKDNSAFSYGGAIENAGALNGSCNSVFINCFFLNNSATYGGAISNNGGGGLSSGPTLTNCSFQNNTANGNGGVLFSFTFDGGGAATTTLTNCVLFGNSGSTTIGSNSGDGSIVTVQYSLLESSSTGYTSGPGNLTTTVSPFASTTSNQLNACAPAINSGDNSATGLTGITTDLAGNPRFYNSGTVDMGAYEFQGASNLQTSFISQPVAGSSVCAGGIVTASVSVSGTGPFTYQWYKGNTILNGQTSAVLSLTNVQTTDGGSYSAVATGMCNSLTSAAFSLTVNAIPTVNISANPPLTITQGQTTTLTASGANSYSWASGETSAAISVSVAGTYSVTATSSGCSSSTSVVVTVNVVIPTINGFSVTSSTVCAGSVASFTATIGNVTGSYDFTLTNGSTSINGTSNSTAFSQTLVASGAGNQSFSLVVSSNGASSMVNTSLTVGSHPDYQTLVDLYTSTNGSGWINKSGWLTDCNPCGWYGVGCSSGRVVSLSLVSNQLSGSIPASLTALTNLHALYLSQNQLTGGILSGLGSLTNLASLYLDNNPLGGTIPASLGALIKLKILNLGDDQLTGEIPQSIISIPQLTWLILNNNQLSGSIPTLPPSIALLDLDNNQLSGCFPASLSAICSNLPYGVIHLSNNAGLPRGGGYDALLAFCSNGQGGDAYVSVAVASLSAVCTGSVVSLSTAGGSSYSWMAPVGTILTNGGNTSVASVSLTSAGLQTFTAVVSNGGTCSQTATVTVTVNPIPTVSINPSSTTLTNASPTASLTATGNGTFQWSTGAISSVISVTTSGTYSVTLTNASGCMASASVGVAGSDLTVTLELPGATFAQAGSEGNFVVNVFEVAGLPTSSGNVRITVTAPVGYTLSFAPSLTTIAVTGGTSTTVSNSQWTVTNSVASRQLTLTMNSGAFISGGGESSLGLSITRTSANSGSVSNITVNVADDLTMSYDGNLSNNGYARIISGL